jgi:hypothetical protein
MKRKSKAASAATIISRLQGIELTGMDSGRLGLLVEKLQSDSRGILFSIVDILSMIPVASGILALNGDGAGSDSKYDLLHCRYGNRSGTPWHLLRLEKFWSCGSLV